MVFYNDHGLNFFLDKLPTFAVGAAQTYRNQDEGWGIPVSRSLAGDPALSWHLINALVADEFDITMCQDMLVDHAVTIPMALMWPGQNWEGIRIVPVSINTVQHPLPSMARCLKLGRSIGRAIGNYRQDLRVLIVGTGGLSHQLDGTRAGFINKEFDQLCLKTIVDDPESLTKYSIHDLVAKAGAQGVRIPELDGDARRLAGTCRRGSPQLSHPNFEYGRCNGCAREPPRVQTQSGVTTTPLTTSTRLLHAAQHR